MSAEPNWDMRQREFMRECRLCAEFKRFPYYMSKGPSIAKMYVEDSLREAKEVRARTGWSGFSCFADEQIIW